MMTDIHHSGLDPESIASAARSSGIAQACMDCAVRRIGSQAAMTDIRHSGLDPESIVSAARRSGIAQACRIARSDASAQAAG